MFEAEGRDVIPANLATMEPGVVLGAYLSAVDRDRLNGHDLVIVMQALARQVAHVQAELMATMVEVAYCPEGDAESQVVRDNRVAEFAADEIRAALRFTRRAAEAELDLAIRLKERLPAVWESVHGGDIDVRRARVIADGTDHLAVGAARSVAERALDGAGELTTGQLRALTRRLCIDADPEDAQERYETGVRDRRVFAEPDPDGTATVVGLQLPPDRVNAAMQRINRIAQTFRGPHEGRTMDQLRADVYLDLLTGTHSVRRSRQPGRRGMNRNVAASRRSGRRGVVDIHVDLETLVGLADRAGEIAGWGPVIADIARQVTADQQDAEWRATVIDDTGRVTWNGTTRRRPTAAQARHVQARHQTCIFPGCRMPATECDLDHRQPFAEGGPTSSRNLAPLCRHDHSVKHSPGWQLQLSAADDYTWTSPLGHQYTAAGVPP
jgi:hypothetical protein